MPYGVLSKTAAFRASRICFVLTASGSSSRSLATLSTADKALCDNCGSLFRRSCNRASLAGLELPELDSIAAPRAPPWARARLQSSLLHKLRIALRAQPLQRLRTLPYAPLRRRWGIAIKTCRKGGECLWPLKTVATRRACKLRMYTLKCRSGLAAATSFLLDSVCSQAKKVWKTAYTSIEHSA